MKLPRSALILLVLVVPFALRLASVNNGSSTSQSGNSITQIYKVYLPLIMQPFTVSRYMSTKDTNTLYGLGLSQANQSGVVILYFGQPMNEGSAYGTLLYDYDTFASVYEIDAAVRSFIDGYWHLTQKTLRPMLQL